MVALFFIWRKERTLKKNMKIRKALLEAGMSQVGFAQLLGVSQPTLSTALANFEFSASETNRLIRVIKENADNREE